MSSTGGIRVEGLTKNYGDLVALNNVSLNVGAGEVVGLIGPNGAGKSTLMKIIVGILKPTSGKVSVDGHDVVTDSEEAKKAIGYLPENPSLYTALTVREFLRFVGKLRGVGDDVLDGRISESLKNFALADKADSLVGALSKGMKQKVALTAAILHDPQVLILDEPQTALDPRTQAFVTDWIASQGRAGRTVLLSTHNLEVVQDYTTRMLIIDKGSMIASGGLEGLRRLADAKGDARLVEVFLKLTEDS
jgi:ABC-2 type transport system ATP-binding protein